MLKENIKKLRKKKGLTQDKLARVADIPYATLNKIEMGVIQRPRIDTVSKIAKGLGVKIDKLVNG